MSTGAQLRPQDLGSIIGRGVQTYRRSIVGSTLFAAVVFAVWGAGRVAAGTAIGDGNVVLGYVTDFAALTLATFVALPWFIHTLAAEDEQPLGIGGALSSSVGRFSAMLGASFFFWAGVMLGIRYLFGIPSIFVIIWYGLFGFILADKGGKGLLSLGSSVRLGEGRRWTIAGLAAILAMLNLLALTPVGNGLTAVNVGLAALLLSITTGISMGAGAALYRRIEPR